MTRWEIVRERNKVTAGWEAQANLSEEGVSLEDAQALTERFYALTISERLKEAGLAVVRAEDRPPVRKAAAAMARWHDDTDGDDRLRGDAYIYEACAVLDAVEFFVMESERDRMRAALSSIERSVAGDVEGLQRIAGSALR